MKILVSTNDGFVISGEGLTLRGPGEFSVRGSTAFYFEDCQSLRRYAHHEKFSESLRPHPARDPHLQVLEHEDLAHLSKVSEQLLNLEL